MGDNFAVEEPATNGFQPAFEPVNALPSSTVDANSLIAQLRAVNNNPDALKGATPEQKSEIQRLALSASRTLEQPFDTMQRIMYSPLQLIATRIGQDHKIFSALVETDKPISLEHLSEISGLNTIVLENLLDYMCSQGYVRETARQMYACGKHTKQLNEPLLRSTTIHFHNVVLPNFTVLNEHLKSPPSVFSSKTAFQVAHSTTDDYYNWSSSHPLEKNAFHHYMGLGFHDLPSWVDAVDFPREFGEDLSQDDVAFVDVGGSLGQECKNLRERYPDMPGRVVLQDLPDVVEKALDVKGMECMTYDYLEEQPVKGARVYYFRQIFHNNSDSTCTRILASTIPAMTPQSVIIIDDKVLPDTKPDPEAAGVQYAAGLSLAMLTFFNAQERREAHWRRLITGAGLVIREIRRFTENEDSLIIAALP